MSYARLLSRWSLFFLFRREREHSRLGRHDHMHNRNRQAFRWVYIWKYNHDRYEIVTSRIQMAVNDTGQQKKEEKMKKKQLE